MNSVFVALLVVLGLSANMLRQCYAVSLPLPPPAFDVEDRVRLETTINKLSVVMKPKADEIIRRRRSNEQHHHYNRSTCDTCQVLVALVDDFLKNSSNSPAVSKAICNQSKDALLCEVVADVVLRLAGSELRELARLHWNLPISVCADILHLCDEPCCDNDYQPEQMHLSFASSDDVARMDKGKGTYLVTWVTLKNTTDAVKYWEKKTNSSSPHVVAVTTSTECIQDHYVKGDWRGIIHTCTIRGLRRGVTYEYQVGGNHSSSSSASNSVFSATQEFTTMPKGVASSESRPLRMLAVADMGFGPNSDTTVMQMQKRALSGDVDMVLHYGDIGYADGNEPDWDKFGRKIQNISSRVPYMTTPGNHECLFNFTAYKARTRMPRPHWADSNGKAQKGEVLPTGFQFYRMDIENITFLMLDTETWIDTPDISVIQRAWIKEQLVDANAKGHFIFIAQHRPLYCSKDRGDHTDCTIWAELLRSQVEALYAEHNVDFVISGHLHNYERMFPVFANGTVATRNTTTANTVPNHAPMYLVNGAAGNKEGQINFIHPKPNEPWSAFKTTDVGYMTLSLHQQQDDATRMIKQGDVNNAPAGQQTAMNSFVLRAEFRNSATDAVVDSFELRKSKSFV